MNILKYISLTLLLSLLLQTAPLIAQDNYHQSIGIRGGSIVSATYKQFIGVPTAIEGIVGFNFTNDRVITIAGLYEYHLVINYQLNFFGGAGIGMAFNSDTFRLTGEGIIGLEYTMPRFPVNFSIDYKPSFHIFQLKPKWNEFGVSLRYIFD